MTVKQIINKFISEMESAQGFIITPYYHSMIVDVIKWNAMDLWHAEKISKQDWESLNDVEEL